VLFPELFRIVPSPRSAGATVKRRVVTHVLVEREEHDSLLGSGQSHVVGLVRFHYGIDLVEIGEKDVRREGDTLYVKLPEPRELDFSVDLESLRVFSKRSGLVTVRDWWVGADPRRELLTEFHREAGRFVRREGLLPSRQDLMKRLNQYGKALSARLGGKVVFR